MTHSRKIIIAAAEISAGGLGSYIHTLAMGLRSGGWEVHLLSTNTRGNLIDRMKNSVECHDLSGLPLSGKKILKAAELVNSISPDILLMNNCALMHYALPLIKTTTKPVAVLHSDDKMFYKTASLFAKRIFRWIAPTRGVAETCKSYLDPALKKGVHTIPHGISEKIFYRSGKEDPKVNGNICFVGFIAENKGADLLPDIFNRVSKECKDARLTIVGQGPLEQTLRKICKEKGMLNKIFFRGAVAREEIAAVLRNSGIFVLPTRIEGFGISIVEAMMSGTVPVVSGINGVTDDIVSDGVTGFIVKPGDVRGFAEAIIALLKNPQLIKSMSMAAGTTAAERFSEKRMIASYEALFAENDDRGEIPCRGTLGWIGETLGEVTKRGIDQKWLLRRALEIWK